MYLSTYLTDEYVYILYIYAGIEDMLTMSLIQYAKMAMLPQGMISHPMYASQQAYLAAASYHQGNGFAMII